MGHVVVAEVQDQKVGLVLQRFEGVVGYLVAQGSADSGVDHFDLLARIACAEPVLQARREAVLDRIVGGMRRGLAQDEYAPRSGGLAYRECQLACAPLDGHCVLFSLEGTDRIQ